MFRCFNPALVLAGIILMAFEPSHAKQPVWIDSDPACGFKWNTDVDDCWAILFALNTKTIDIRGISTVFGNVRGDISYKTLETLKQQVDTDSINTIYRGASDPYEPNSTVVNEASKAIANVLKEKSLTIIALGPLTNIASLIVDYPESIINIKQIIAVAGQRPDSGGAFFPTKLNIFHMHDINFRKDIAAFKIILASNIPLKLIPYELAQKVAINTADLDELSQGINQVKWLADVSRDWLRFWKIAMRRDGFFPFHSLAVGSLIFSSLFKCEHISAQIETKPSLFVKSRDRLVVSNELGSSRMVEYCYDVESEIKYRMMQNFVNIAN